MESLSPYKYKRIAEEALLNAIRLHLDAMLLYKYGSYPSAFQLSVLSLEEFAKAKWVDHCYDATVTNNGFPKKSDPYYPEHVKGEQEWLNLLFIHTEKQFAFIGREIYDYSPKFVKRIMDNKLEQQKQDSTYVGLVRQKRKIDTASRISIPTKKIKKETAKQIISLINHEFILIHDLIVENDYYWGNWDMNSIINEGDFPEIFRWPYKSGLKSRKWLKHHHGKGS